MSYKSVYIRASEVRAAAKDLESCGDITEAQLSEVLSGLRGFSGRIYAYMVLTSFPARISHKIAATVVSYAAHCHAERTNQGCPGCSHCISAAGLYDQDGNDF